MAKKISIINQKGGVGKSTVTANLGSALARKGFKTLLIDLDLQCNLSAHILGFDDDRVGLPEYLIEKKNVDDQVVYPTKEENLFIIPSNARMLLVERELINQRARENILSKIMRESERLFDYILIDNPPSLSTVTDNSLTFSDYVLVPLTTAFFSMIGLKLLSDVVKVIVEDLNENLKIIGYIVNMFDTREAITKAVLTALKEDLGDLIFETKIRVNTNFKVCPTEQNTIFSVKGDKRGKKDFEDLVNELLGRLDNGRK